MYTPTSTLSHINSYILLLPRQQRQKFPVESETPGAALEAELPIQRGRTEHPTRRTRAREASLSEQRGGEDARVTFNGLKVQRLRDIQALNTEEKKKI